MNLPKPVPVSTETRRDTFACAAVLLAMVLGVLAGAFSIETEATAQGSSSTHTQLAENDHGYE